MWQDPGKICVWSNVSASISLLLAYPFVCFLFFSCAVRKTEASRPSAIVRWRRSWRKPGRWLPRYCHRGLAPTALPSTVWPEGSQWGRTRTDRRLPQDTLPRYWGRTFSRLWRTKKTKNISSPLIVFHWFQISPRSAALWCSHHCCILKNGTFPWTGSCQTRGS